MNSVSYLNVVYGPVDCSEPNLDPERMNMNGVDKLDQMTRENKFIKTMKWYRRIERKLMETSLYNA